MKNHSPDAKGMLAALLDDNAEVIRQIRTDLETMEKRRVKGLRDINFLEDMIEKKEKSNLDDPGPFGIGIDFLLLVNERIAVMVIPFCFVYSNLLIRCFCIFVANNYIRWKIERLAIY